MTKLVEFATEGVRRRPDSGLYFYSACGRYALYCSDQLYGMPIEPPHWLGIEIGTPPGQVLRRGKSRQNAVAACRRHARAERAREASRQPARGPKSRKRAQASPGAATKRKSQRQLF